MVAQEYNDPAGVYKVQTFGTLQYAVHYEIVRCSLMIHPAAYFEKLWLLMSQIHQKLF